MLESQIQTLSRPQPEPVPPLSAMAQSVSGKSYVLETNSLGIDSFILSFSEEEARLKLFIGDDSQEVVIGLDNVYRINPADQVQVKLFQGSLAIKGYWEDEDIFLIYLMSMDGIHRTGGVYNLCFYFDNKGVVIQLPERIEGIESISGIIQD